MHHGVKRENPALLIYSTTLAQILSVINNITFNGEVYLRKILIGVFTWILLSSILCVIPQVEGQEIRMPTVWVKIYRIQAVDPIDIFGEADWYYEIQVWNGQQYIEKTAYATQQDKDDVIENKIYSFEKIGVTEAIIRIYLYDDDGIFGFETADISGASGRSAFYCTYNLKQNTLTGDQVIVEGGYYKTSGDYDGSVATDENDANLWFTIWDNYDGPIANAGSDQTCYSGDKVNFDGSASTASDGSSIVKYEWDFESDGVIDAESAKTSYTYSQKGVYTVTLRVTDSLGQTNTDTCIISVLNRYPTASFTWTPSKPTILDTVNFVDTSEDVDGSIVSWIWNFGDGTNSTDRNPPHKYSDKGNYTVTLTVSDNDGASNTLSKTVTIYNIPPTASFMFSPSEPMVGVDVQFTDESTDPEGKLTSWLWNFGDGYTSTTRNPTHKYQSEGAYNVTLSVTDDEGETNTISKTITIKGQPFYSHPWFPVAIIIAIVVIVVTVAAIKIKRKKPAKE